MKRSVTVVGGGLAGSETALQLSSRGISVDLIEMRPGKSSPAHKTPLLAELVCSNSLKSKDPNTASGIFKRELGALNCKLLKVAEESNVPAGHALAVDRDVFSGRVTELIQRNPYISVENREQLDLDLPACCVIATGPLTSESLSHSIMEHFSSEHLFFYDAISISISTDSINTDIAYKASRYGKGGDDYWNIPFTENVYRGLVEFLRRAPKVEKRGFEESSCFEACLPVEVIASRGEDALRFGPMKPKGLNDPKTGREPYAVLQLRQETIDGTMFGLVGFQTRLTRHSQKELMRYIPGLEHAEIMRWGSIHRNTFIESPLLLDEGQMSRERPGLFFAGQIVGVEGYQESIAHGLLTALNVERYLDGLEPLLFPDETLIGGLQRHLINKKLPFQPMNVNFGLLPPTGGRKRERKKLAAERSRRRLAEFLRV